MAYTIDQVCTEIAASYIRRNDINDQLAVYTRNFYRTLTSKVPFEELMGTDTVALTIGANVVNLASTTADLAGIKSIRINYLDGTGLKLKKDHINNFDKTTTPPNGKTMRYARFGQTIELWPPPAAAYILTIRYWKKGVTVAEPSHGTTTMLVPDEWIELIQWEVMYRALIFLGRHQEAMNLIIPAPQPRMPSPKTVHQLDLGIIPRLWNELLSTVYEREFDSDDFSINPLRRTDG